jgi:hypothetical protein
MSTSHVDKLIAAKLIELADLTQKEIDLINSMTHHEIDAIISAGHKFQQHVAAGGKSARIIF